MNRLYHYSAKLPAAGAILMTLVVAVLTAQAPWTTCGCAKPDTSNVVALPHVVLVDQNGKSVVLSSLKGKPLLVDFIYTSCPGPCRTLTQNMERIAARLGPELGSQVTFVSISIDPEHEGPPQLLKYATMLDADRPGWLFLSGGPGDIDAALAAFHLKRERTPDGDIQHLEEVVLVDASGRAFKIYKGDVLHPDSVIADLKHAAGHG
jgi:protein SCO1/2